MKGSESQKWSVNFIDGYFEYILSLYKKDEYYGYFYTTCPD